MSAPPEDPAYGSDYYRGRDGELRRVVACPFCDGRGWDPDPEHGRRKGKDCGVCKGTGRVAETVSENKGGSK